MKIPSQPLCPILCAYPPVRMKLPGRLLVLGVVPIVHLARAQVTGGGGRPSGIRAGIIRFAEEGILEVGASQVHAIAHGDEQVGESLIEQLQANGGTMGETPHVERVSGAHSPLHTTNCGSK